MAAHPGLDALIAQPLSSVEFVYDYIQLRFDWRCLSIYAPITVEHGSHASVQGNAGFPDAIVACIGGQLQSFELNDHRLVLSLSNDRRVIVPLVPDEDEAALLNLDEGPMWSF